MRRILPVLPALLVLGLLGCSSDESLTPPREIGAAHVQGVVTRDGLPVAKAIVRVLRDGVEIGSVAITDARGRFCVEAPTFAKIDVRAQEPPPEGPVCETWSGFRTITTGDFGSCGAGPEYEIVLIPQPI